MSRMLFTENESAWHRVAIQNKRITNQKIRKRMSRRTLDDLSDEEYEDYEKNPENYQDVTDATNEDIASMMGDYDDD